MGMPAARVGDLQSCPNVQPPAVPHVGGAIQGPGCPTVLIEGQVAAGVGDLAICAGGPPNAIKQGAPTTLIGGRPAARALDPCAHPGSTIVAGSKKVLIG